MTSRRAAYPSDVSDDEWAFVASYLCLMKEDAPQRAHSLREVFNALRWLARAGAPWRLLPHDFPSWRVVYQQSQRWIKAGVFEAIVDDGHKRKKGSKVHGAVDTLGHLLVARVSAASEQERAQVAALCAEVQALTGQRVQVAYVDQGYSGETPATEASAQGITLAVVKHAQAKRGFVLLPRRWVVERSFAWMARFRRLARDYERLPTTLAALHFLVFTSLLLSRLFANATG